MGRKDNRRVQRTQQLLRTALASLIEENGFEALTVQDILDRANVGRATFYAHFDNKEDLLVSGFDRLRAALKELQRQAHMRTVSPDERLFAFSHEMFAHIAEYRKVFRAMVGKRSGALVQQLLHKIVVDLVRDDLKAMGRRDDRSAPTEAVVQFVTGGFFGVAILWATGKLPLSVEGVNALFRRLAMPGMKAALP
ncbi:MAG: TetR/AcrR family transcriptional regulator [Candidatus Sulfotelmatobacter sp.]